MKSIKTALVTGCTSGIGYATCLLLARNSIMTYGTVRNLSKSEKIQKIIDNEKILLKIILLDVNNSKSISKAVQKILHHTGRIDILVNNAGYGMFGPIENITIGNIKQQFETNFFGAIRVIKSVVPIMRKQGYGTIVNISSMVGRFGVPLNSAYVSSKFAIEGLSESISFELEKFGIKVIVIEPGVVQTNFFNNLEVRGMDTKSPYHNLMKNRVHFLKRAMIDSTTSANQVAKTILHALNSNDPEFRYVVGIDAENCIDKRGSLSDRKFMKWVRDSIFHDKSFAR